MLKRIFSIMTVLAVLGVAAATYFTMRPDPAPASQMLLLDGSKKATADYQNHVTLVNFWATSCTTCVAEMPMLTETYNKYQGKGYRMVAVAMAYDKPEYISNFVQTRQLPFDVAYDHNGQVAKTWGDISITPTTFLLDKQGHIIKRYVGAPDEKELHALIEKLLAAS